MSPSFVLLHVKHLPMGSSFVAEMRGGQVFRDWNIDRYLRVAEVNTLKALLYVYLASHVDPKKTKVAQPDPWPIPDAKVKTKQSPKPGSFAAIALARLAAVKKLKEGGVV